MKTLSKIVMSLTLAFSLMTTQAEKKQTGPKGGRLLENELPRVEFFVEKDKTISLAFYDANLKPVPVTEQTATAFAETKDGKKKIEFEKKGDALVSKSTLPEGDGYNVVLQLKSKADAKSKNFRIPLHLEECAECKHPEYACVCHE